MFFCIFLCGLECVSHSFAYVDHFVFLGDICIRTQRAAIASRCATNLATNLPSYVSPILRQFFLSPTVIGISEFYRRCPPLVKFYLGLSGTSQMSRKPRPVGTEVASIRQRQDLCKNWGELSLHCKKRLSVFLSLAGISLTKLKTHPGQE